MLNESVVDLGQGCRSKGKQGKQDYNDQGSKLRPRTVEKNIVNEKDEYSGI